MAERILICGVNWLGDSIMSMPALQAYKAENPSAALSILTKQKLAPLWERHPAIKTVISFESSNSGTFQVADQLCRHEFERAFVFPNSFRSAFIVYRAGIPRRRGVAGHWRRLMLNDRVKTVSSQEHYHQAWEYFRILGLEERAPMPDPGLYIGTDEILRVQEGLGLNAERPMIALIPGAARGDSKRWPWKYFAEAGKAISREKNCRILVLGTEAETALCADMVRGIGATARNLAGRTSLVELMTLLAGCHVVVANDSGGMHLAAGVGTPVVAVFGMTDPGKTGPVGNGHRVLSAASASQSRDIARHSMQAAAALRSIPPARVIEAAYDLMASGTSTPV